MQQGVALRADVNDAQVAVDAVEPGMRTLDLAERAGSSVQTSSMRKSRMVACVAVSIVPRAVTR